MTTKLVRTIYPEVRVIDAAKGIVDYVASDQTIDSYKEVIRADGWRFSMFAKNAPFVDSHNYGTIGNLVGKVISFEVVNGKLVERVQWAIDVPENTLAKIGWKMTEAGYLKAVSVGFWPTEYVMPGQTGFEEQIAELHLDASAGIRTIYTEQEQVELSSCIIGANPNALLKAKAITEQEFEFLNLPSRKTAPAAAESDLAAWALDQTTREFIHKITP